MEPFYIQTDLSPATVRWMAESAKSQARRAISQHREAVANAVTELEKILALVGGELETASGAPWGVGLASNMRPEDPILLEHRVFLVENAGSDAIGTMALTIKVTTTRFAREIKPGVWRTGYRTVGVSHVPDDNLGSCVSPTVPTREFFEDI